MLNEVTEGTIAEYCAIRPHTLNGLLTVFTSPFVHGSFEQMAANTLPFGTIGFFVLYVTAASLCMSLLPHVVCHCCLTFSDRTLA